MPFPDLPDQVLMIRHDDNGKYIYPLLSNKKINRADDDLFTVVISQQVIPVEYSRGEKIGFNISLKHKTKLLLKKVKVTE